MGCATLTKGPVGSIFPCACIGVYQLLRGRSFWKAFFSLVGIGLLSFVPYLAWVYVATDKVDNRSSIWFWRRIPGGLWAKCPTSPMKILYGIIS